MGDGFVPGFFALRRREGGNKSDANDSYGHTRNTEL
jgi:hypothetical protein